MATTVAKWAIVVLFLTFVGLILRWQIRNARAADAERDRLLFGPPQPGAASVHAHGDDDRQAWTSSSGPVRETSPGVDLGLADECALIYSMPAFAEAATAIDEGLADLFERLGPPPAHDAELDSGCDRLRQAIRDEQQKGESA